MITITEAAQTKIAAILEEENNPSLHIRMFVQGGGCSGFQYGFTMDEVKAEDDLEIAAGKRSVLVDPMSFQYLENATIDFKDELSGASFSIDNPQATSTCGCGSSFSV
jgi:iron-sulfur cluster insertion protein